MEKLVNFELLQQCYRNKKVFLTGHTGFKGSWLSACLHLCGAQVKGYALAPAYENGLFNILQPFERVDSVIADIRDKEKLRHELLNFQPDYIFHLAAQPLVRRSYKIPAETFETNVVGTANLLESLIALDHKCSVIIVTTDKVYENKEKDILYAENDALGGYDPYSASKACAELVVSSFRNSFFNPDKYHTHQKAIVTARAGNVIGGGDWSQDRIIPDIVKSLMNGEDINVRNPNAVRPWQHVLEPVVGYLLTAGLINTDPSTYSSAYNFGPLPEDHLAVKDLVQIAIKIWGNGNWKDTSDASEPHEAGLLQLNIELAAKDLNWHPKLSSSEAIEWTMQWYKQARESQAAFTMDQIKKYILL